MKVIILGVLSFYTISLLGQTNEATIIGQRCELLKTIFSEDALYKLPSLNLKFSDTINVFDKQDFFYNCNDLEVNSKKIILKSFDQLPHPLIGAWSALPEYREKYKCYFIIESLQIKGSIVIVDFFKVLSNHKGFFIYKIVKGKFKLIDYELGQY